MKILITLLFSLVFGLSFATWNLNHQQKSAIAAGVAEYALNPKTGQIEFHYLPAPSSKLPTSAATPLPNWNP